MENELLSTMRRDDVSGRVSYFFIAESIKWMHPSEESTQVFNHRMQDEKFRRKVNMIRELNRKHSKQSHTNFERLPVENNGTIRRVVNGTLFSCILRTMTTDYSLKDATLLDSGSSMHVTCYKSRLSDFYVFAEGKEEDLIDPKLANHAIDLKEGREAPFMPIYGMSPRESETLREYLYFSLRKGWIRQSSSQVPPFSSLRRNIRAQSVCCTPQSYDTHIRGGG